MKKAFLIIMMLAIVICCAVGCGKEKTPAAKVTMETSEATLEMGESRQLIAYLEGTGEDLVWISSDDSVVSVKAGKITALKDGIVKITASAGGASAECSVTVTSSEKIVINREEIKVFIGKSVKLTAEYYIGRIKQEADLIWSSSDASKASVADGVVTGVALGEVEINVKVEGKDTEAVCKVEVKNVVSVRLNHQKLTLYANETEGKRAQLTASVFVNGEPASVTGTWESGNEAVVSVTAEGTVTALSTGKTYVAAVAEGERAVCEIEVYKSVRTVNDLKAIKNDLTAHYMLMNDLDLGDAAWDSITPWFGEGVAMDNYFGGVFEGNGHTITNLKYGSGWHQGLFGQTNTTSVIRNFSLINATFVANNNKSGAVCANNYGLIENVYVESNIASDSQNQWNSTGGVVAVNTGSGTMRNVVAKIAASQNYRNCGWLAGYNWGVMENCFVIGTGASLPLIYTFIAGTGSVQDCYLYGSAEQMLASEEFNSFDDSVWTVGKLALPFLKYYADVEFSAERIYIAKDKSYVFSPASVAGAELSWSFTGNDDFADIQINDDYSLTITGLENGVICARAELANGRYAETEFCVVPSVITAEQPVVALDFNHPDLENKHRIKLIDEEGKDVTGVLYSVSNDSVIKVTDDGLITAVSGGTAYIDVRYSGVVFERLIAVTVNPWIQISTAEQFDAIRNSLYSDYVLIGDIDFGGAEFATITPWDGLGEEFHFGGTFDGRGYAVKNVQIASGRDTSGIFGQTAQSSVIKNVNFIGIKGPVNGSDNFGIVGFNMGLIENMYVEMSVTTGGSQSHRAGGGIAGTNEYHGIIRNSIAVITGSVHVSQFFGGVVGLNQGNVIDSFAVVGGSVSAICYQNGYSTNAIAYRTAESLCGEQNFVSFDKEIWFIQSDKLPVLIKRV